MTWQFDFCKYPENICPLKQKEATELQVIFLGHKAPLFIFCFHTFFPTIAVPGVLGDPSILPSHPLIIFSIARNAKFYARNAKNFVFFATIAVPGVLGDPCILPSHPLYFLVSQGKEIRKFIR
jgi:hypothetical protein